MIIPAHIAQMASYQALLSALRDVGVPVDRREMTAERFWALVHIHFGVGSPLERAHVAEVEASSAECRRQIDTAFAPRIGAKALPS